MQRSGRKAGAEKPQLRALKDNVLLAADRQPVWETDSENGTTLLLWGRVRDAEGRVVAPAQLLRQLAGDTRRQIDSLRGQFALVFVTDGSCWLVADRFLTHRLAWSLCDGVLYLSDRIDLLASVLPSPPEGRLQAIVDYLFFHMIPGPETLYAQIQTLAPAEVIRFDGKETSRYRHWNPQFTGEETSEDALCDTLFDALERAVAREVEGEEAVGCFLSGGLDSSSICGLTARYHPAVPVFSIGFTEPQYNELEYARCAVSHFGLDGHEYVMEARDVLEALPRIVASMEQPFGNSSIVPAWFCARLAHDSGVRSLIAGDGGDELFAGNARYAHQLRLDRWRQRLGPLVGLLNLLLARPGFRHGPELLRKAASFSRQLGMTIPQNLQYYNFLNLIDRSTVFSERVCAQAELYRPDRVCESLFAEPPQATALDRMLWLDWKLTLADNDLVKVASACTLAGVEVRYPMLDDDLVDLSLRIPADLKLTPGNLRHLYKRAMAGFLPDKIIQKPKHGFGLPFGLWTARDRSLREMAYAALDRLDAHDLFRPGFIDEVKRRHQQEHAKHYGELVWILMVLSLWLDQRGVSRFG